MPTDVISKIGMTNSPTTMDYSSLQAWEDACPANLVTADQRWIGECYDQGKFTSGLTISGQTVDATRYVILRCASGASFNTKSGVRTNPLFYSSTTGNGVAIEVSSAGVNGISISTQYTVIDGLQIKQTAYPLCINAYAANITVQNCIFTRSGGSGFVIQDASSSDRWINCLIQYAYTAGYAARLQGKAYNCTFVNVTGSAGTTAAIQSEYNVAQAMNCAFFGFNSNIVNNLNSSSDYNATDLSTISTTSGGGSHNIYNLSFAAQFESMSFDFRSTTTGGLKAGSADSTNAPLDISLTTRDVATPYIGCWEASVTAPTFAAFPSLIRPKAVIRSNNY